MERKGTALARILNSGIDGQVDDDTNKGDIVSRMARAAGISSGTVNQILNADINCPPISRLEGFSSALGISMARLRSAAESDGCEYDGDKAKCCVLNKESKILDNLTSMKKSIK